MRLDSEVCKRLWHLVARWHDLVRSQRHPDIPASTNRIEGWFGRVKLRARLTRGLKTDASMACAPGFEDGFPETRPVPKGHGSNQHAIALTEPAGGDDQGIATVAQPCGVPGIQLSAVRTVQAVRRARVRGGQSPPVSRFDSGAVV